MSTPPKPKGMSFLFSFPFWIFVDTSAAPSIKNVEIDGTRLRIYPLFRSGAANFIPMPPIDPHSIPFAPGTEINIASDFSIPTMAVIPELQLDAKGRAALKQTWGPDWGPMPRMMPMDSLRLDLLRADNNDLQAIAENLALRLIQSLRSRSRQWWIEQVVDAGFLRSSFPILEQGQPVELPIFNGRGGTIFGDERPITEDTWKECIDNLRDGAIAPLYDLLVLDARFFAATADIRRSVIDAATACEQARDVHFERWWHVHAPGSPFKLGRVLTGNNLPHHLHRGFAKANQQLPLIQTRASYPVRDYRRSMGQSREYCARET